MPCPSSCESQHHSFRFHAFSLPFFPNSKRKGYKADFLCCLQKCRVIYKCKKAIVDISLPVLCNPTTPSQPIGCIACVQKFSEYYWRLPGILNAPFCCMTLLATEISLLQQMPHWCCRDHCSEDCQCFWMACTPENCPFSLRICTPSNTWFLGPTRVFIQNGISISLGVFAKLTIECPITSKWAATFSSKNCPFSLGDRVLHLTHGT